MTVYKIRNKDSGLYSTGGTIPGWSSKGKTWSSRAAMSNHLFLATDWYSRLGNDIIEIIEIKVEETPQTCYTLNEWQQRRRITGQAWLDSLSGRRMC